VFASKGRSNFFQIFFLTRSTTYDSYTLNPASASARKALEQEQLKQLYMMSLHHPDPEKLEPSEFGFVCSSAEWKMFYKRIQMLTPPSKSPNGNTGHKNRSQSGHQFTRRVA
jgi:hypothetical protein